MSTKEKLPEKVYLKFVNDSWVVASGKNKTATAYVPESALAEARADAWKEAYDFVNLKWHSGMKFEKILDELLKKTYLRRKKATQAPVTEGKDE